MKKILMILCYCVAMLSFNALAEEAVKEAFEEGKHYTLITPEQPAPLEGKVEVLEAFWFGCPHCYEFEPFVERWLAAKAPDVEFVRLPVSFRESWMVHAKAYYAAEALGVKDKISKPLFDAMHKEKRKLDDEASLADFFAEQGVDKQKFIDAYNSFGVNGKVQQAMKLVEKFGIDGVPAVIVNRKYKTSGNLAGNYENLLKIVDFLVNKERGGTVVEAAPAAKAAPAAEAKPAAEATP
jgi:thiol:disulfide interchange protein DsbA